MEMEEKVMTLIVSAGCCRSLLMQALQCARTGDFQQAETLIAQAQQSLNSAHAIQTKLIEEDQGEGKLKVNIIMVHAQDHVMNAVLLLDLTKEFIEVFKRLPK